MTVSHGDDGHARPSANVPHEREDDLVRKLQENFPADIKETNVIRPARLEVSVTPEKIRDVAMFLRDKLGFDHPNGVSAVDYNRENRFEIVYHISSIGTKQDRDLVLHLKESIPRNTPKVGSLTSVWPGVENYERESYEMFGIQFDDHPRLEKLFLNDNWDGPPPMRKEIRFPTD
jgi:NADH:ubiquinone oxidoreductase subunit C